MKKNENNKRNNRRKRLPLVPRQMYKHLSVRKKEYENIPRFYRRQTTEPIEWVKYVKYAMKK